MSKNDTCYMIQSILHRRRYTSYRISHTDFRIRTVRDNWTQLIAEYSSIA